MKRYNFAIIPPDVVKERAIEISKRIAKHDSLFILNEKNLHPHISLYHVTLDPKDLPTIIEKSHAILRSRKPFQMTQDSYRITQGVWVDVAYAKKQNIMDIHTALINATKDFRLEKGGEKNREDWTDLTEEQKGNILNCGWASSFDLFTPHLTFTKLKEGSTNILTSLPHENLSFLVESIGLFELGDHGTCTNLIAHMPIGEK